MSDELYEKLIYDNEEKGYQYKLVVSEFRGVQYLHIRKYFQSYEGDYIPSSEGASIPATMQNTYALLDGLIEICSKEEAVDSMLTHFKNKLSDLQCKVKTDTIDP